MRDTFVDDKSRSTLLGAGLAATDYNASTTVSDPISAIVLGYDFFKSYYSASLPASSSITDDILTTSVYTAAPNEQTYRNMTSAQIDATSFTNVINYSKILGQPASGTSLLKDLNKVRNTYTFLKDSNLRRYKAGAADDTIKISNYNITIPIGSTTGTTGTDLAIDTVVQNIWEVLFLTPETDIPTITTNGASTTDYAKMRQDIRNFDVLKNDVFVIRRMLLLFEMMANIYISMYLLDNWTTKQNKDSIDLNKQIQFIRNISNTAQILLNLNKTFTTDTAGGSNTRSAVISRMREDIRKYLESSSNMNTINTDIFNLKMDMTSNKSLYEGSYETSRKASAYEKTMIALFVMFIVAILGIAMYPMPKPIKIMSILAMFVFVVVFAFILKAMFGKKLEGFEVIEDDEDDEEFEDMEDEEEGFIGDGLYLVDPSTITTAKSTTEISSTLTQYNKAFIQEALDYLNITMYVGITLQSSQSYRNMNDTLGRETNYFEQVKTMLDNTNNRLSSGASVHHLDVKISRARVNFFIQLGIIIALCVLVYIIFGDNSRVQPYIFATTGLLILLIVFLYMHEVAKYVHTDGTKFYWAEPSNLSVLDN